MAAFTSSTPSSAARTVPLCTREERTRTGLPSIYSVRNAARNSAESVQGRIFISPLTPWVFTISPASINLSFIPEPPFQKAS